MTNCPPPHPFPKVQREYRSLRASSARRRGRASAGLGRLRLLALPPARHEPAGEAAKIGASPLDARHHAFAFVETFVERGHGLVERRRVVVEPHAENLAIDRGEAADAKRAAGSVELGA